MKENSALNLRFSREAAAALLDLLDQAETPLADAKNDALRDMIKAALFTPQQPTLEEIKEEARTSLAQAVKNLAQAESTFEESFAHGSEGNQRTALAALSAGETRLRGSQAAYDAASRKSLDAAAESAEGNRLAAYAKSEKAYDDALGALRAYEPLAQEISKLFRILSFHIDLALADTEAADAARINPHAANAAGHLKKILQDRKMDLPESVTKHVSAALHELELGAHAPS